MKSETVVIFSGGTDSTCAAALAAAHFQRVHLLTYHELATRQSSPPQRNVASLRKRFPEVEFRVDYISVDRLVRHISYDRYWHYLRKHKALVLATCGFSTLSWHVRTIIYCLQHEIHSVSDGLTRELMHFPGHMDDVIELFRALYGSFGIEYSNPVRDWAVPEDRQFIDQMIINNHSGDFILGEENARLKTTGQYLYDLGILPKRNLKGSRFDRLMQQDCYPFTIYNIMCFWLFLSWESYPQFCARTRDLFQDKIANVQDLIREYLAAPEQSRLSPLIEGL
jgi:NH3-dependent NAD+ synthetase